MEKLLPNSQAAEREALYKMIVHSDKVIARTLVPEDFYDPVHRDIFTAEAELLLEYGTGDFISICEAMKKNERVQKCGGTAFLAELCILPGIESPTTGIVRVLKSRRIEREMLSEAGNMGKIEAKQFPSHLMTLSKQMSELLPTEEGEQKERIAKAIKEGTNIHSTGYQGLDTILNGGFRSGALYTFAARPGGGKSTLLTNFAASFLSREIPFLFISLEMTEEEVMTKIIQSVYDLNTEEVEKQIEEILEPIDTNFTISDNSFTLSKIQTEILCTEAPLIFIDYVQLIRDPEAGTKLAEVTNITRTLKLLAMETKKPIITASQMSRDIEKDNKKANAPRRQPALSDLRESGSIEQDCNVVGFLWRPDEKDENGNFVSFDDLPDLGEEKLDIIIRKNRHGKEGTAHLHFNKAKARMYEKI